MSVFMFDSNSDLSYKIADQFPDAVPVLMPYVMDDEVKYYDLGRHTDFKQFYDRMRAGAVPKTMALNPAEYEEYIEPIFKSGNDVLYVSFSHAMSGTFNNLNAALEHLKESYPERKLTLVDTASIAMGEGLLIYYCLLMKRDGATDEQIIEWVNANKMRMNHWFCVDDLIYLKRGGRISSVAQVFGSILEIKPVLTVSRGGIVVVDHKEKGRKKSIRALVDAFDNNVEHPEEQVVYVVHSDAPDDAQYIAEKIREKHQIKEVVIQLVGPVIGTHAGPGTVGILFLGACRQFPAVSFLKR